MNRLTKTIFGMATAVLAIAILGIFGVSSSAAYNYTNIIELGEYPQTEVTDYSLKAQLNALGGGSTVYFEGERYKRVCFEEYTPSRPDLPAHEDYSSQDDNGYCKQTVYWFRYEPIRWKVLNNTDGELLMISEKILDAKPFNSDWSSGITWMNSSVRGWLNGDFAFSAFSLDEVGLILDSNITNPPEPFEGTSGCANTTDRLFFLSFNEATNGAYAFGGYEDGDVDRLAEGTDFAKCNGLYVNRVYDYYWLPVYGKSLWHLRTTGEAAEPVYNEQWSYSFAVSYLGNVGGNDTYYRSFGVRPAFRIQSCELTFDANGGTGDKTVNALSNTDLTAPIVSRPGYVFAGWEPEVPELAPEYDTVYTAQWTKIDVRLTKLDSGMRVNLTGWEPDKFYQVWGYSEIAASFLVDDEADIPACQWVLLQPYTAASYGYEESDGGISFFVEDIISPDGNYTVAVRVVDTDGNYCGELRDTYTDEDLSVVRIAKVLADGDYCDGFEIRECGYGTKIVFTVIGNNVEDISYYAHIPSEDYELTQTDENVFEWSLTGYSPGTYTVELIAQNSYTEDVRRVKVQLYSSFDTTQYAEISALNLVPGHTCAPLTFGLEPTFTNGTFWFRVGEPGRSPQYTSGLFWPQDDVEYTFNKPGIYRVFGYVNRQYEVRIGEYYDDAIAKTVRVPREDEEYPPTASLSISGGYQEVEKGTKLVFNASAQDLPAPVEYSFWRYDARGYLLIRDWSTNAVLSWTPARVGNYTIEVRVKGAGAGSYEAVASRTVFVYDDYEDIARDVTIILNHEELNETSAARKPVIIKAHAESANSNELLYKFNIHDEFLGSRTLRVYSPSSNCVWTPRKDGEYTITVMVKNAESFGKYDALASFTVTVEAEEEEEPPIIVM